MKVLDRIVRHARITWRNYQALPSPPFLILFINSICNMKCEHCFYWRNLNRRDDLTKEELVELSRSLGRIENLSLSGGEPFLRPEFGEICRQFIRHNQVGQIYVPTNGYFTDRMVKQISETLTERALKLFVVEISLDGMPEFHNEFRVSPGSFEKAMQTYDVLAELQERDPRLRIHAISTATDVNMEEIRRLTTYLSTFAVPEIRVTSSMETLDQRVFSRERAYLSLTADLGLPGQASPWLWEADRQSLNSTQQRQTVASPR